MYTKNLILILFMSSYCYSAEGDKQLIKFEAPPALLPALLNIPQESKVACLEVLEKTTRVTAKLITSVRQIVQVDSQAAADRIEKSTQAVSKIISHEVKNTMNDLINIVALKTIFAGAIYHGYTIWNTHDHIFGLCYMMFGLVGFLCTQQMLDQFEPLSDAASKYIQNNLMKKLKKVISKFIKVGNDQDLIFRSPNLNQIIDNAFSAVDDNQVRNPNLSQIVDTAFARSSAQNYGWANHNPVALPIAQPSLEEEEERDFQDLSEEFDQFQDLRADFKQFLAMRRAAQAEQARAQRQPREQKYPEVALAEEEEKHPGEQVD
jgi:hypothetical protein